jgi:RHS repeat-associated protein
VSRLALAALAAAPLVVSCAPGSEAGPGAGARVHVVERAYFHDGIGPGPALVTGDTGAVVDERRVEPYGAPLAGDLRGEPHDPLGGTVDPSTGLADHGARWLAGTSGRWLAPDPLVLAPTARLAALPWDLHPYQYARSAPTLFWDPDGRDLAVTGVAQKRVLSMLESASGFDLSVDRAGRVSIVGATRKGPTSGMAALVTVFVVLSPSVDVHVDAVAGDDEVFVGARTPTAGHYQIDADDLRTLRLDFDPRIAHGALVHELFEAALHSRDPSEANQDARHTAAIGIENQTLEGTGFHRTDLPWERIDEDTAFMSVDYGPFEVQSTMSRDGHHGQIVRFDHK